MRGVSSKVFTSTLFGLHASTVEVEADIANGLPAFNVVGLADTEVKESRERVKSAIKNSGLEFPGTKVLINLAPADVRKEGPQFDLPVAVAVLQATGLLAIPPKAVFLGELALDGSLRKVAGVLAMALEARDKGYEKIYLPEANAAEAALVRELLVYPIKNLLELVQDLTNVKTIKPFTPREARAGILAGRARRTSKNKSNTHENDIDFAFIRGQESAKRALEIAASGNHNILFSGPPGTGKTLLAQALIGILPRPALEESLEITKIYSVAGLLPADEPLIARRPFRAPHHGASAVALVGGGTNPRPGEITLAHRGVLFLDEIAEFGKSVLDQLRQPLENKSVVVSRASGTVKFPTNFMLVAARNPCPCGHFGDEGKICVCGPSQIQKYKKKLSGPLLDRIDIHIDVPRVTYEKLMGAEVAESSANVRARVEAARAKQLKRFKKYNLITNSEMSAKLTMEICKIDTASSELLRQAVDNDFLSPRGLHRLLRVSRTIADLENSENIELKHVSEALGYRTKD